MYRGKVFAGVTAALVLLVAACGDDSDATALVDNVSSQDGSGGSGADEQSGADDQDGDVTTEADGPIDATPGDEVLASVSGDLERGVSRDGRVTVRVEVTGLERQGDLVDLTLNMTNEDEFDDYQPYPHIWVDETFRLVDRDSQRVYLAAVDSAGDCLCNTDLRMNTQLAAGETLSMYARFAGIPDDVSSLDVQSEHFPPMSGVPVSG